MNENRCVHLYCAAQQQCPLPRHQRRPGVCSHSRDTRTQLCSERKIRFSKDGNKNEIFWWINFDLWAGAGLKMWNASRFCVSSLRRGHANLLCIVPILVYVLPKQVHRVPRKRTILTNQCVSGVPLAQWIARWTSNPKVLGSTPRWDDSFFAFFGHSLI